MYGLLFAAATVRTFFDPAWESVLPEIASEEELTSANSFLSISSFGSTAVGFALAGLLAGIDIHLPFYIDALTFALSFVLVLAVRIPAHAAQEESTTVGVDHRQPQVRRAATSGRRSSCAGCSSSPPGLPVVRPVECAAPADGDPRAGRHRVRVRPPGRRDLDRFRRRQPPDGASTATACPRAPGWWPGPCSWACSASCTGLAPDIEIAILLVMVTGFLNSPMSIARRGLLQKNIPRAMRGRVFSAFSVSRDVVFLIGMAGAALADDLPRPGLIVVASLLLVGAGVARAAGAGHRANGGRMAAGAAAAGDRAGGGPGRRRPRRDDDRLRPPPRRLPELGALAMSRRAGFISGVTVARAAPGEAIVKVGDPGDAAFFVHGRQGGRRHSRTRAATAHCRPWARATSSARSPRSPAVRAPRTSSRTRRRTCSRCRGVAPVSSSSSRS